MRRAISTIGSAIALSVVLAIGPAAGGITPASYSIPTLEAQASPEAIVQVFIQFAEPSVAEFVATRPALSSAVQRSHSRSVRAQQDAVTTALEAHLIEVRSRLVVAANGIRALVRVEDIDTISAFPGVKSVSGVTRHTAHLTTSVGSIGAASVTDAGYTGAGVTVAVIDTGIDYTHASFGGPGTAAAYALNDANTIEPGSFPTLKVIDGFDFAGTDYDAGDPFHDTPVPDPDPLDGSGHGTHVAATVAGIDAPGPLVAGVAQGANLMALKVFGDNGGSTDLVSDAIEMALDPNGDGSIEDRVDVINMSLGSDFGQPNDPSAIAAQNAADNGVVVVASAGNSGAVPYVTGSPALADGVISVAASVDFGEGTPDTMATFTSRGPGAGSVFKPDISAPGFRIAAAAVGTGDGTVEFNGTSMAAPHVAGTAAQLLERYPGLEPAVVKALLMNSTRPALGPGKIPLATQGTGVVQIDRAALDLGGYASPGGVSFGHVNPAGSVVQDRTVTINRLPAAGNATYDIELVPNQSLPGVVWSLSSSSVTTIGGVAEVQLRMTIDPSAMNPDDGSNSQSEADGWVRFTNQSDADDTMVVGYLVVADPAAGISAETPAGALTLKNSGPASGLAEGFTLAREGGGTIDALGYRTNGSKVEFGLALDESWDHPSPFTVYLYIDVDDNGSDDFLVVAIDSGYLSGASASGNWITATQNMSSAAIATGYPATADLNDRVAVLTVDRSGAEGFLAPGDDDFTVDLYVTGPGGVFGFVPNISVDLGDEIVSPDGALGATVAPATSASFDITNSGTLLWLFSGNRAPDQVEIVAVSGAPPGSTTTTSTTSTTQPDPTPPAEMVFVDVPDSHVFHGDIIWLANAGVTNGCNPPLNDRFCPDDPVSRGQMAAFLNRALWLDPTSETFFKDVANSVFNADINQVAASGITRGCNPPANDLFCPERNLTRAEMATFMVRGFNFRPRGSSDLFSDDDDNVHETAIDTLGTVGVTRGCNPPTNNRFCPDRLITRGEMAAFLARADQARNQP